MNRDQIAKLIGGYATGTLTPAEREALFEAALDDQALFDELAREQSLEDLLRDPSVRAHLLAALGDAPLPWHRRAARWIWGHAVGVGAVACFVVMAAYVATQVHFAPPHVRVVATTPESVEVTAKAPDAKPRAFEMSSLIRPARVFDSPPPPAVSRKPVGRTAPTLLALASPPAMPPPPPQTAPVQPPGVAGGIGGGGVVGGLRQNFTADGLTLDGISPAPAPSPSQEVAVSAAAAPVPTAASEPSKLLNSRQALAIRGQGLSAFTGTNPDAAFGSAMFARTETDARSLFYEGAGIPVSVASSDADSAGRALPNVQMQATNSALGSAALTGTVTDPGGAAVPNAQVQVRDNATGAIRSTVSDSEGVFRINNLPPARYDLTVAGVTGFKQHVSRNIDLAANQTRNLGDVALDLGSVTEAVSVTGAAMPIRTEKAKTERTVTPSAPRQMAGAARPVVSPAGARSLGIRYQVLRRLRNGNYEPASADSLSRGDTIKLRFTPNAACYLWVAEPGAKKPLLRVRVERLAEILTAAVKAGKKGPREFLVAFTPEELAPEYDVAAAARATASLIRSESVAEERTTYVVSVASVAPPAFVITLNFQ